MVCKKYIGAPFFTFLLFSFSRRRRKNGNETDILSRGFLSFCRRPMSTLTVPNGLANCESNERERENKEETVTVLSLQINLPLQALLLDMAAAAAAARPADGSTSRPPKREEGKTVFSHSSWPYLLGFWFRGLLLRVIYCTFSFFAKRETA